MSERPTTDCTAAGKDYFGSSEMSKPGDVPGPWNSPDRRPGPDARQMGCSATSCFLFSSTGFQLSTSPSQWRHPVMCLVNGKWPSALESAALPKRAVVGEG